MKAATAITFLIVYNSTMPKAKKKGKGAAQLPDLALSCFTPVNVGRCFHNGTVTKGFDPFSFLLPPDFNSCRSDSKVELNLNYRCCLNVKKKNTEGAIRCIRCRYNSYPGTSSVSFYLLLTNLINDK
jgi:hypothetical protein